MALEEILFHKVKSFWITPSATCGWVEKIAKGQVHTPDFAGFFHEKQTLLRGNTHRLKWAVPPPEHSVAKASNAIRKRKRHFFLKNVAVLERSGYICKKLIRKIGLAPEASGVNYASRFLNAVV